MGKPIADFKDLDVWQVAMDLAAGVYAIARLLPVDERFGLAFQLRRAAVSVPSNIAEGYGRGSLGDYLRFLRIANGSLKEIETQLLLTRRLQLVSVDVGSPELELCSRVGQMLTALRQKLSR